MADEAANPKFDPTVRYSPEALERARQLVDDIPEQIGPYRILERIGHGGMGDVYRAEQRSPIRREVALKFIKLGMDTKAVIARFEAERQALAMMDHPHIAKVFDAGADDLGRPYFVMEYVKGLPITEYADAKRLTIPQRLRLFEQVCQAIQHAHHKGVIHRDIKPSNVLVSTQDDQPFAKVIDFGVAKALSQQLTDKTLFTRHDQFIGTPQYMSPEQAEGSLDIDTRSDVYSLGVLLYELLSGSPPFNASELKLAAFEQLKKLIREVDPPAPSLRLSQSGPTLPQIATNRQSDVRRLGPLVRGELDWIVMKALEKDRRRRYETPTSLASDIQAHLKGEAIQAAPPSKLYQLQKILRRHKGPVITIAAVMLALLLGIAGTTWGLRQAQIAKAETEAYAGKLQDAYGRWYAESNRHAMTSEAKLGDGFRVHVDYSSGEPRVRTWIEEGADLYRARMQVADDLGAALLHEFRANEAAIRDLKRARDNAERMLAKGLLRSFAVGLDLEDGPYTLMKQAEINSYVEWCRVKDGELRLRILEVAFEDPATAVRIAERTSHVVHAVAGISPKRRQKLREWLIKRQQDQAADPRIRMAAAQLSLCLLPMDVPALAELLHPDSPLSYSALSILVHRTPLLSSSQISECAALLPKLVLSNKWANQSVELFKVIAPRLTDDELQTAFDDFVGELDGAGNANRLSWVLSAHAAILHRLSDDRVIKSGNAIISQLLTKWDRDSFSRPVDEALAVLTTKLPPQQQQKYAQRAMRLLETSSVSHELDGARQLLGHLSVRLPERDLDLHADRLLERLVSTDGNAVASHMAERLQKITAELSNEPQKKRIDRLLEALRPDAHDDVLSYACSLLKTWAPLLSDEQAQRCGDRLIVLIGSGLPLEGPYRATDTFALFVPRLRDDQVAQAAVECRLLLGRAQNDWLGMRGIVALVPRLTSEQAEEAALEVLDSMKRSRYVEASENHCSVTFAALGPRLTKPAIEKLGDELLAHLVILTDRGGAANFQRGLVLDALGRLAPYLSSNQRQRGWTLARECWILPQPMSVSEAEGWARLQMFKSSIAAMGALGQQLEDDQCALRLNELIEWASTGQNVGWAGTVADLVAALAPRLTGEQATHLGDLLINWYQNAATPEIRGRIEQSMRVVSPRITAQQSQRWAEALSVAAEKSTDRKELSRLGESLNTVAPQLTAEQRERAARSVTTQLIEIAGEQSPGFVIDAIQRWDTLITAEKQKDIFTELQERWKKRLEDPNQNGFFVFYDAYITWDPVDVDRICELVRDERFVAQLLMRHDALDGYYGDDAIRARLLERFEELVLYEGTPMWSKARRQETRDDDPRPLSDAPLLLPERKFRTVDDAAAWIAKNWSDFDLEAVWSPQE